MPPLFTDKYIFVNTHEAKTNLAKYIRILESGKHDGLFIKRYNEIVAFMLPYKKRAESARRTHDDINKPADI